MNAGKLRHRVTLEEYSPAPEADGGEVPVYYPVATVWAEVLELRGRQYLEAREAHSDITTRIRIRHRTDVRPEWRVRFGATLYRVEHVVDLAGRRRELELLCVAIL